MSRVADELLRRWAIRDALYRGRRVPLTVTEEESARAHREREALELDGADRRIALRELASWNAPMPPRGRGPAR